MISEELKSLLKKQKYRFAGSHSLVKICHYTQSSMTKNQWCYKNQFYGIKSHQCLQCTTTPFCFNQCIFCWRAQPGEVNAGTDDSNGMECDNPEEIIEKMLEAQRKLLSGIGGHYSVNSELWREAQNPKHVALSVLGEPIAYPKLKELLSEFHKRGMSTFLVTAGGAPGAIRNMIKENYFPTQLYISMAAFDEDSFNRIMRPKNKDGWKRYLQSLKLMKEAGKHTRTVVRMTLIKGLNMDLDYVKDYGNLIRIAEPHYVEVKAYMAVGFSRKRVGLQGMPYMEEIREFAEKLGKEINYIMTDEHKDSRVVLLSKDENAKKNRFIDFTKIR
ncbi:MAG: 4-demethylwyosine synthase TYW1 [Candidatus Micrarchaeota archaeon]|nr:4-demethylwyosine synthase TYW1 [Candidatus Micrarchaeota archaeon]